MIDVQMKISGDRQLAAKLQLIEAAAQGKHPEMVKAWKQIGAIGLRDQQQMLLDRARSGFARLGLFGVLLRRGSGPIASYADAMRKSATLQPLRDTGVLFNSLTVGGRDHVLETGEGYVRFGTRVPYAKHHHKGGTAPFRLTDRSRKIVADNLKFSHGAIEGSGGRDARGKFLKRKQDWNPWAFMILNALAKKTEITLPARPIIVEPKRSHMAKYLDILRMAVRRVLGK